MLNILVWAQLICFTFSLCLMLFPNYLISFLCNSSFMFEFTSHEPMPVARALLYPNIYLFFWIKYLINNYFWIYNFLVIGNSTLLYSLTMTLACIPGLLGALSPDLWLHPNISLGCTLSYPFSHPSSFHTHPHFTPILILGCAWS